MNKNQTETQRRKYFAECVAAALMERGLVKTEQEGKLFALSLDLSYEQDYSPRPMAEWMDLARKEAAEYEESIKRG